jgi:hypothetical protein
MKVAILIPTTTKKTECKTIKDTYLYKYMLPSFCETVNLSDIVFYIGYDYDDEIYKSEEQVNTLINKFKWDECKSIDFKFIIYQNDIKKGHLSKMWNVLYEKAYEDGFDYFYQCGDDILFKTKGWLEDSISALSKNDDIGVSGPRNNNILIITQALFSRKHMQIFGHLFPEEIINYYVDDWYNMVYSPRDIFILNNHLCINNSGQNIRYDISKNLWVFKEKTMESINILKKYKLGNNSIPIK